MKTAATVRESAAVTDYCVDHLSLLIFCHKGSARGVYFAVNAIIERACDGT